MRRKPTTSGSGGGYNNNQQRSKPRYQQGGSNGGEHRSHNAGHHNSGGRPRKNYSAMREKYLLQARDALASGDRVLAENYFQHADHCYRMMVEEGYQVRNNYTPAQQGGEQSGEQSGDQQGNQMNEHQREPMEHGGQQHAGHTEEVSEQENLPDTIHQLPAFLTANFEHAQAQASAEPVIVQSWEE